MSSVGVFSNKSTRSRSGMMSLEVPEFSVHRPLTPFYHVTLSFGISVSPPLS